jgi:lipopolysaccharide export system permease protein
MRSFLMARYVLSEMIPTFFLGVFVFIFILLMFQALRLTEFVLVHGVKLSSVGLMMGYMSTSFLPILFPMSLLFAVLLTYSRLSADSEIVAFKAVGLSMVSITTPALVLGILVCILSLQTSFHIAPWGNRQFELLITKLGSLKPGVSLKEGTFAEGFFDLVVYANKVEADGRLNQVFIYDERQQPPMTIISKFGSIVTDPNQPGHRAQLQLNDGSIHRVSLGHHTKIDFSSYKVFLSDPIVESLLRDKTPQSMTIDELRNKKDDSSLKTNDRLEFETEYFRRTAMSIACILFALIGVGLGTVTNRRNVKGGGMVICIGLIVVYWVIYVVTEGAARQGQIPPIIAMWIPNFVFSAAAFWSLRRAWN